MGDFKWTPFFVWLFLKVGQAEASHWTNNVPSSVEGVLGSCVVIPCSFDYPDPDKKGTKFTGIWLTKSADHVIYHPDTSRITQQYRGRTELLGDVAQKNCSLKIDDLQQSDRGPFYFRIEIQDFNKFSFKERSVSISVIDEPNQISVKEEVLEGETVAASCSMTLFCSISPPVFNWSHSGEHLQSQQFSDSQWKVTDTLTFRPTLADHNTPLLCNVKFSGGRQKEAFKILKVKHAPVNVEVEHKAYVKEGEAVQLKCSSDAHPPASTYTWHNESGAKLHQGNTYMLPNVSRHVGALYCTAINTVGLGKSIPVQLSVLYAPEIKSISCSSEGDMVKCMCIAESKPSCMVHFVLSDRILTGTKVEKHGSVTIGTLQGVFGSSEFIQCLANNTEGNATHTSSLPVSAWTDKVQNLYIVIAVGSVVVLVVLVATVGFVKKCMGNSAVTPTHNMSINMAAEEFSQCTTPKSQQIEFECDDVQNHVYDNNDPVYGNMETDDDNAIYINV